MVHAAYYNPNLISYIKQIGFGLSAFLCLEYFSFHYIYKKEKRDVWLFLDLAKEDIEKASDEIDQGEMGGMDMDGFPGTGGDEPTEP